MNKRFLFLAFVLLISTNEAFFSSSNLPISIHQNQYLCCLTKVPFLYTTQSTLHHLKEKNILVDSSIRTSNSKLHSSSSSSNQLQVILDPTLTDERITELFAWISCAFRGDPNYDNLMLGIIAIFGTNLDPESAPKQMAQNAILKLPGLSFNGNFNDGNNDDLRFTVDDSEICVGTSIPQFQREQASLGAMGAAQWTGQWRTRPHALLEIKKNPNPKQLLDDEEMNLFHNFTCVEDWVKTLPRGCKRTLKKANALIDQKNITVITKPIYGGKPAPHSSLAHFKCVVEHEVRLLTSPKKSKEDDDDDMSFDYTNVNDFFNALSEAVGRYVGTTRMTGQIQEYRNTETNQIIAFAHEVRKGRTIRGQWFYATDEASKNYVWFHSVQDLVRRAIETEDIDVVDLGPSGSDAFSELKARYGFISVNDWPSVADYQGPFYYEGDDGNDRDVLSDFLNLFG